MKIFHKFMVVSIVSLVMLISMSVFVFIRIKEDMESARWVEHTLEVTKTLLKLSNEIANAESEQRGYILTNKESLKKEYIDSSAEAPGILDTLEKLTSDNPKQQERIAKLRTLLIERLRLLRVGAESDAKKPEDIAKNVGSEENFRLKGEIEQIIMDMEQDERDLLDNRSANLAESSAFTMRTLAIGSVIICILIPLGTYGVSRGVSRSLGLVMAGAERIGRGELAHEIAIPSRDEVGALAGQFNRMAASLRLLNERVEMERRTRDETVREMVTRLSSSTAEILAGTAEQMNVAQEQATSVTETVATVEQITQVATQSAERAKSVTEGVRRSIEIGQTGRRAIDDSLSAQDRLRRQVESTAENILTLAEQAQAIGEIINVVNDIAEQVNLLALNAAIEAARAGSQGKGFAVVAGEVRALADQCKKATVQVRQILGEIQKATNTGVISIEEVTKGMANSITVGNQTKETIVTLGDSLADMAKMAAQIVASVNQQATGMNQIHMIMNNIDRISKQNLSSTRQVEQAAHNLNSLGNHLVEITKLDADGKAVASVNASASASAAAPLNAFSFARSGA